MKREADAVECVWVTEACSCQEKEVGLPSAGGGLRRLAVKAPIAARRRRLPLSSPTSSSLRHSPACLAPTVSTEPAPPSPPSHKPTALLSPPRSLRPPLHVRMPATQPGNSNGHLSAVAASGSGSQPAPRTKQVRVRSPGANGVGDSADNGGSDARPPPKRARKAINCEPCRNSKLKCDRCV